MKRGKQKDTDSPNKTEDNINGIPTFPSQLPIISANRSCDFHGYDVEALMKETAPLRKIVTKRGTLEIIIPLCCSTKPVRHLTFKTSIKGLSSKTLATRLRELERTGILERHAYNEIPPRVEYQLTPKGQELVESVINLLEWMRKWSPSDSR